MRASVVPFAIEMRDAEGRARGEGRGVHLPHLGEILTWRQHQLGMAPNETGNDGFAQTGFMFEMFFGAALAKYIGYGDENLIAPGEVELDGVLMNPDRFDT